MFRIAKFLLPATLLLSSCFWGDKYETRHLIGHYYLDEVAPKTGVWYLHFDDEKFGLADALFNCQIVEAGFNERCIIMRAVCTNPQFYIVPVTDTEDREAARRDIRGPFSEQKFKSELKRICGDELPQFDSKLINPNTW